MSFSLVVGTKTYSSWSLRAWLAAKLALGNSFEEVKCFLAGDRASQEVREERKQTLLRYSPTGKVPALVDKENGNIVIYDSLAIVLYLGDRFPESGLFPRDLAQRGLCYAACAEMHSGFSAIRTHMPHNCVASGLTQGAIALAREDVREDILRVASLWTQLRTDYGQGGPYLFGQFGAADCMYAPLANRFNMYDPELTSLAGHPLASQYVRDILNHPFIQEWTAEAKLEGPEWKIADYEVFSDK